MDNCHGLKRARDNANTTIFCSLSQPFAPGILISTHVGLWYLLLFPTYCSVCGLRPTGTQLAATLLLDVCGRHRMVALEVKPVHYVLAQHPGKAWGALEFKPVINL